MPCVSSVPLLGFGYPFSGLKDPYPLESDICFQRSWVLPFKALFLSDDRKRISPLHPFVHFNTNPRLRDLVSVLQRFDPTRKAVPLSSACSEYDLKAGGNMLSEALSPSRFSPFKPSLGSISLPNSPLSFFVGFLLQGSFPQTVGFLCLSRLAFSRYGRRPAGCF